jgi:hypothetical protein
VNKININKVGGEPLTQIAAANGPQRELGLQCQGLVSPKGNHQACETGRPPLSARPVPEFRR